MRWFEATREKKRRVQQHRKKRDAACKGPTDQLPPGWDRHQSNYCTASNYQGPTRSDAGTTRVEGVSSGTRAQTILEMIVASLLQVSTRLIWVLAVLLTFGASLLGAAGFTGSRHLTQAKTTVLCTEYRYRLEI